MIFLVAAGRAPSQTGNPPCWPRTSSSTLRGRSRSRRATRSGSAAIAAAVGNDAAHFLHRSGGSVLVGRPQTRAHSNWSPAKITAADSSSCRRSHGRNVPADGRRAGCRSRPGRARSVPARCDGTPKQVPQQTVQILRRVADLVIAPAPANKFQPVQVLLPAKGSSSSRLPLNNPSRGSQRNCS